MKQICLSDSEMFHVKQSWFWSGHCFMWNINSLPLPYYIFLSLFICTHCFTWNIFASNRFIFSIIYKKCFLAKYLSFQKLFSANQNIRNCTSSINVSCETKSVHFSLFLLLNVSHETYRFKHKVIHNCGKIVDNFWIKWINHIPVKWWWNKEAFLRNKKLNQKINCSDIYYNSENLIYLICGNHL